MATVGSWNTKKGRTWWVDYYYEGKRRRKRVGRSEKAARSEAARIERAIRLGDPSVGLIDIAPADALEEYLESAGENNSEAWVAYKRRILTEFLEVMAVKDLRRIKPGKIEQWQRGRRAATSVETARKNFFSVQNFLKWAKRQQYVFYNPAENVEKLRPAPRQEIQILSTESAAKLLEACEAPVQLLGPGRKGNGSTRVRGTPIFEIVSVALYAGLRRGEILHLTWDCIDLAADLIHVKVTEQFTPKDRESRSIPLHQNLRHALLRHQRRTRRFKGLVFESAAGGPFDGSCVSRELRRAAKRADIPEKVNFTIFRHTFASSLTAAAVPERWIASYLGHQDTRTTSRHYARFQPEKTHGAIAQLSFGSREA